MKLSRRGFLAGIAAALTFVGVGDKSLACIGLSDFIRRGPLPKFFDDDMRSVINRYLETKGDTAYGGGVTDQIVKETLEMCRTGDTRYLGLRHEKLAVAEADKTAAEWGPSAAPLTTM